MKKKDFQKNSDLPLIPANKSLPEITLRGIVLGVILTVILSASNAYLGLKAGQTISASIPAAIISLSILSFFRNSNVLENTMVQTMASVGEALIAGVTFILPALIILHAWEKFYYWQTVMISLLGGTLGVLFTIPLRRALLLDTSLRYPEGIAISNVFKASLDRDKKDMTLLSIGGLVGALISLCQTGFQIFTDSFNYWFKTKTVIYGFGFGTSPALIAAGYIIGGHVAFSILIGIIIGWVVGVPVLTSIAGFSPIDQASDIAMNVWRLHLRYIGVGTMMIGSLWTLLKLIRPILDSIMASLTSIKQVRIDQTVTIRTEHDIPMNYVLWSILLLLIPIFFLVTIFIIPNQTISSGFQHFLAGFSSIYILIGGFIFCSIAAYFAGLIGSTNTPVSGLVISVLLILSLFFLGIFKVTGSVIGKETIGAILAIGGSVIISAAIAIANDTMQDLKVGQIVGATPWKQQLMLIVGVILASFVVPPILELLYNAYGIGGVFPRPNMDTSHMLAAPQAGLMATIAKGVYTNNLEWIAISIGVGIGIFFTIVDGIMQRYNSYFPVLAVGIGIYLPLEASVPLVIGGILAFIIQLKLNHRYPFRQKDRERKMATHKHRGLLVACGIVAGSSLMSVLLAIPFVITQSTDALKIMPNDLNFLAQLLGVLVTFLLCGWVYVVALKE